MFKKLMLAILLTFFVPAIASANQITVYYFHGDIRCFTCNKMENYTSEVVANNFKKNKNIVFKSINHDKDENKLLKTHYGIYTNSVIVADTGSKWKNLDKIWTLAGNEDKFKSYINDEINNFIGG